MYVQRRHTCAGCIPVHRRSSVGQAPSPRLGYSCTTVSFSHLCCAQSLRCVQFFATPWTVAHQAPLSMGILQARILEWVVILSSRGSSQPRDRTQVSCTAGRFFTVRATREALSHAYQSPTGFTPLLWLDLWWWAACTSLFPFRR